MIVDIDDGALHFMNDESLDLKGSMAVNPSWLASIIKDRQVPGFITVEGPIGVGKTSLALLLSETLGYEPWLESSETNPFLKRFYENQRQAALQTQLFFLFEDYLVGTEDFLAVIVEIIQTLLLL